MRILPEDVPEEGRTGRQYQLVCLDLPGTTTQGAVKEILFFPDLLECQTDVALEVIPAETKILT